MMLFSFFFLLLPSLAWAKVEFAEGTKPESSSGGRVDILMRAGNESDTGSGSPTELPEAELRKIVAERPEDDPLNAFYDPYEPYRLSTYAYWHPIADSAKCANPLIPTGFLPPFAPPKNFPADFFLNDDEARNLVAQEHAAASCPFLRRWREKHPLRPYPIGPDFMKRHPPIKFDPKQGYQIDLEQARLNALTERIRQEAIGDSSESAEDDDSDDDSNEDYASVNDSNNNPGEQETINTGTFDPLNFGKSEVVPSPEDVEAENREQLKRFKVAVRLVMKKYKKKCQKLDDFTAPPKGPIDFRLDAPLTCLEEAIFLMEKQEDMIPVGMGKRAEIVDKKTHFLRLMKEHLESKNNAKNKSESDAHVTHEKISYFKGTIPKWAMPESDEELYSSTEEVKLPEKYSFAYNSVPLPSIQNTLQKFVNL